MMVMMISIVNCKLISLSVQSFSKLVIILEYIHSAATSCNRMGIGCWQQFYFQRSRVSIRSCPRKAGKIKNKKDRKVEWTVTDHVLSFCHLKAMFRRESQGDLRNIKTHSLNKIKIFVHDTIHWFSLHNFRCLFIQHKMFHSSNVRRQTNVQNHILIKCRFSSAQVVF